MPDHLESPVFIPDFIKKVTELNSNGYHEFRSHAELEDDHWWFKARREIILDS
jgi:hypothetical protein